MSKAFSLYNEMIMWVFFSFQSVCVVDYSYLFLYVEPSLYLWHEAELIMVHDLFDVFFDYVYGCFACIYVSVPYASST